MKQKKSKIKTKTVQKFECHPTSIVDLGAKIGAGTKIWHFSHICGKNVSIGKNCSFGQNTYVGNNVKIGNGVRVQNNVSIYDEVELEDDVFCGPSIVFTNVINPRSHVPRKHEYKKTCVKKGATLGANCTIVCGNSIGEFAFVGAGAVVANDVPNHALVVGVPAKQIGWMCRCGVKLPAPKSGLSQCKECGDKYSVIKSGVCVATSK
jgi:UDP-2-acetamido-3-amino-2,3-dideoxy-glucuronate N-acetyltransferase